MIRRAKVDDATTLLKLAKMVHFINLPPDKEIITQKIVHSRNCFLKLANAQAELEPEPLPEPEPPPEPEPLPEPDPLPGHCGHCDCCGTSGTCGACVCVRVGCGAWV